VDFRNVVLIMTSNIGAELIKNKAGFGFSRPSEEADYEKMKQTLLAEIERYFRPEFINRLDDVIVFRPLNKGDLINIVEYELRKVRKRLGEKGLTLELEESAKDYLIEKGYNPDFGARPLRRAIEHYVEDPISEEILRGGYKGKNKITVSVITEGEGAAAIKHLYFDGHTEPQKGGEKLQEVHEGT
jgi:ATP-dependent Clp protease ATP-binding subunit ClpC